MRPRRTTIIVSLATLLAAGCTSDEGTATRSPSASAVVPAPAPAPTGPTGGGIAPAPPVVLGFGDLDPELVASCLGKGQPSIHAGTGMVRFISTEGETVPVPSAERGAPEEEAVAYLNVCAPLFGVPDPSVLEIVRSSVDEVGNTAIHFRQLHGGVPVLAGELVVQISGKGGVTAVSGELMPGLALGTAPTIDAGRAQQTAIASTAKRHGVDAKLLTASQPELRVYAPVLLDEPGEPVLAWSIVVSSSEAPVDEEVLVDASEDGVLLSIDRIDRARDRDVYDNENASSSLPGTGPVREEGEAASNQADADRAYELFGAVYDYYVGLGRDSFNGAGATMTSTVRYCAPASWGWACPMPNAFWHPTYGQFAFGQGYVTPDIVGHEFTHAVTDNESGLVYQGESGAIDESLADAFGQFVDITVGPFNETDSAQWLIGDDLSGGAIRSMSDPPGKGQPDRLLSASYYSGTSDNGGVHTNSGVANKAWWLAGQGGADTFNGRTVSGIGIAKLGRVLYRAQADLLTSGANHNALYDAVNQSCQTLIGTSGAGGSSITSGDCAQIKEAMRAVEMNAIVVTPSDASSQLFAMTIARHDASAWLFGARWVNTLKYLGVPASGSVLTTNTSPQTIVDIPGFGGVRDTGDGRANTLVVYSSGKVVEYTIWSNGSYVDNFVPVGQTREITFPRYRSFMLVLARPSQQQLAWVLARENDGHLAYAAFQRSASASLGDSRVDTLASASGLGSIADTGDSSTPYRLRLTSNIGASPIAYTLWYRDTYATGTIGTNASTTIDFPKYTAFLLNLRGPDNRTIWMFGKENDKGLVVATLTSTGVVSPSEVVTLLDVSGLGQVRNAYGTSRKWALGVTPSSDTVVEWSWWRPGSYAQGEARP